MSKVIELSCSNTNCVSVRAKGPIYLRRFGDSVPVAPVNKMLEIEDDINKVLKASTTRLEQRALKFAEEKALYQNDKEITVVNTIAPAQSTAEARCIGRYFNVSAGDLYVEIETHMHIDYEALCIRDNMAFTRNDLQQLRMTAQETVIQFQQEAVGVIETALAE